MNEGIIGNRLLQESPRESEFGDALGASGLHRFDRDVLAQPGVRVVVVRVGGNDLGFPGAITPASRSVSAADLIAACPTLAAAAHRHGVRVVALTIAPFGGVMRDPGDPARLRPSWDSGDHLHPNDAGDAAAAGAIPLSALGAR